MPEHLGDRLVRGNKGKWLDAVAAPFGAMVGGFYRLPGTRWIKDILHGTWPLRHPLHPALTDAAVGGYTVLAVLDVLYLLQREAAVAEVSVIVLVFSQVAALAAALSGLTDWNDTNGNERRLGILHGLLMTLISAAYVGSLIMRSSTGGTPTDGALYLALGAWLALVVAAHLGGEMTYGFGTGVGRHAWATISDKWQVLQVAAAALEDRKPVRANMKNGFAVMVVRMDDEIQAIAAACTHAGGPLDKGRFVGRERRDIECPWHMSVFSVSSGSALHGPATIDEPTFETRIGPDGNVEVRARGPRTAKSETGAAPSSAA